MYQGTVGSLRRKLEAGKLQVGSRQVRKAFLFFPMSGTAVVTPASNIQWVLEALYLG